MNSAGDELKILLSSGTEDYFLGTYLPFPRSRNVSETQPEMTGMYRTIPIDF